MKVLTPDICVIGAGSGGLSVAAAAAAFGVSVVLVERGRMGGDCLNYGCVPSKSLLAAAHHAAAARRARYFGVTAGEPVVDFARVHAHVQEVIAGIAPNDSVERFTGLGVHVISAEARFTDERTVEAGDAKIRARRFVVASGSSPRIPPIPGLADVPFLTNETIFDEKEGFRHLLAIGGGPVGVELAQAWRRLGCDVSLLTSGRVLGREEPEMADVVARRLRAEGVALYENAEVLGVEQAGAAGIRLRFRAAGENEVLEGSHCLVATGRQPNVGGLGLENAGIDFGTDGIKVSGSLRTSNKRVYAVGDVVAGSLRFTHVANYHAGLAVRAILFRMPVRENRSILPRVTYTDPELAAVGLTERQAREKGETFTIVRWPFQENDRAQTEAATDGGIKVIAGRRGKILGVSIAGAGAGDVIGLWSFAMARGNKLSALASFVAPYPTRDEIGKRAAVAYFAGAARNPWLRRIVRFLRFWG